MKSILIVLKLFFLGGLFIISNNELYMGNVEDREIFMNKYTFWVGNLFGQILDVTGYVVKFEWLPETEGKLSVGDRARGVVGIG